jgi:hypothetical protein
MASLGQVSLPPEDMATVVGAAIGHAAGTALRAGRKFMKQLGVAFSREEPPERRALPPPPTLLAGD